MSPAASATRSRRPRSRARSSSSSPPSASAASVSSSRPPRRRSCAGDGTRRARSRSSAPIVPLAAPFVRRPAHASSRLRRRDGRSPRRSLDRQSCGARVGRRPLAPRGARASGARSTAASQAPTLLVGEAAGRDREARRDAVEPEVGVRLVGELEVLGAILGGATCVSGSGAKTRGVQVSERSTTVRPFAAASSTHTLPFSAPAAKTGTVSHPARDGVNGFATGAGGSTGSALGAAAGGALVDAEEPSPPREPWQAPIARVKRPSAPRRPRTDEERSRPGPSQRVCMPATVQPACRA